MVWIPAGAESLTMIRGSLFELSGFEEEQDKDGMRKIYKF